MSGDLNATHLRTVERQPSIDVTRLGHYCALCRNCLQPAVIAVVIINQAGKMLDKTLVLEMHQGQKFVLYWQCG